MDFSNFFGNIWVQITSLILFATVHGYLGAWLAVRMLFRPRLPFKVFGITLFPQGMIPKHRTRLAEAIGKAVGEELVSQETILDELFKKDFLRRKIQKVVDSYTEEILSRDYPSLIEALPANVRAPVLDAIASLQLKVAEHIENVLQSEETLRTLHGFVERRVDEVLSRRVSEVVDEENFNKILGFLETRIQSAVRQPAFALKIKDFIDRRVDDLAKTETPLGQMFTNEAVGLLKEKAAEQIEPIIHQLAQIAAADRTRDQIGALIKREVHTYYEQLPFFKKIFVSRENLLKEVDDLVNVNLPKRIEETLRGDFFAQEARNFLNTTIDNALLRPLPEVIGTIVPDQLESLKSQILKGALSLLRGEEMLRSISAYLTDTLQKLRPHSIDAILETLHSESEEKLKNILSKGMQKVLSREETSNILNAVLSRQIEKALSAPIGKLSDYISETKLREASQSLTETIVTAAREKLPEAIREFDVGNVVREKINNYPVEKLEALVLSVAKEHLRTIELFGALFGLIIGIMQAFQFYFFARH
ncbi:MAG: hypothetical protein JWN60_1120 [Acidobacteria bacterium]|jgi:uncharacterized membrane protein YheB (UPF0754 family)|nr:hypothetical protein [Acidobacteriota bacterium]